MESDMDLIQAIIAAAILALVIFLFTKNSNGDDGSSNSGSTGLNRGKPR